VKRQPISTSEAPFHGEHAAINPLTREFCRHIEVELVAILDSSFFRSSRRSCEFLRHVVESVLAGRAESLKERAIGIEVLGREPSYDTGSDAAVRVRANDVRKRLGSYYEQNQSQCGYRIELPPGSYAPQFVKTSPAAVVNRAQSPAPAIEQPKNQPAAIPALETRYLAGPTVLALFICAIAIRYQLLGATPFHLFWDKLLKEKSRLTVVVDGSERLVDSAEIGQIQVGLPLLMLAQAFQVQPSIRSAGENGHAEPGALLVRLSNRLPVEIEPYQRVRFVIQTSSGGPQIVDRQTPAHTWIHAALITVLPDAASVISIGATDMDALSSGIRVLTDRTAFPHILSSSLKTGEVTQALFDEQGHWIDPAVWARQ
jgi:hypothetical protein